MERAILTTLFLPVQKNTDTYFVKAMTHYKHKEMLVTPFNMGNYWLTLSVSTTYD
jgi:hypothetical protein